MKLRRLIWHIYMLKPVRAAYVKLVRLRWLLKARPTQTAVTNDRYSIGVVTYVGRYSTYFKPLIGQLTKLFPDTEIVIAVNGHYDQAWQARYLADIAALLGQYKNVHMRTHEQPESLSKLWNELIIASSKDRILILNDDVLLLPSFRKDVENSPAPWAEVALLKSSWSHFFISKNTVAKVGWFDERFPAVGNEDEDYESRLALMGEPPICVEIDGLRNISEKTRDFSYGRNVAVVKKKYVSSNKEFFDSKWELSPDPRDGFTYVRILRSHIRLRPGMETPNFHPSIELQENVV